MAKDYVDRDMVHRFLLCRLVTNCNSLRGGRIRAKRFSGVRDT